MHKSLRLHKIIDWGINIFLCICGMGLLWLVIQVFCVTSFHIPSDSMEPELLAGDAILVNKMKYGARLFNIMEAVNDKQVKIKRLPGLGEMERNVGQYRPEFNDLLCEALCGVAGRYVPDCERKIPGGWLSA